MKPTLKFIYAVLITCGISQSLMAQELNDSELKKYIRPVNDATGQLVKLKPELYEFKTEYNRSLKLPAGRQFGFNVENVETVFPQLVKSRSISYTAGKNLFKQAHVKEVSMEGLIPVLVASISELQAELVKLRAELEAIKRNK